MNICCTRRFQSGSGECLTTVKSAVLILRAYRAHTSTHTQRWNLTKLSVASCLRPRRLPRGLDVYLHE
ncbi:hypothetical protein BDL97_08G095000 [Sphagnum fallax]|nr:hypothetical protein BDL97_08G095000 [Sphagnum fallax]